MTQLAIIESATFTRSRKQVVAWYRADNGARIRRILPTIPTGDDIHAETHAPDIIEVPHDWSN